MDTRATFLSVDSGTAASVDATSSSPLHGGDPLRSLCGVLVQSAPVWLNHALRREMLAAPAPAAKYKVGPGNHKPRWAKTLVSGHRLNFTISEVRSGSSLNEDVLMRMTSVSPLFHHLQVLGYFYVGSNYVSVFISSDKSAVCVLYAKKSKTVGLKMHVNI